MLNLLTKVSKWISTKADKESDAVKTNLTFDLSGLSEADVLEYAIMHLVVKWQDQARRAKGDIPTSATYKVPKPGTRSQADPTDVAVQVLIGKGYSEEDARALISGPEFLALMQNRNR